ncbi:MAG: mammalian cell entry protein [Betaproteobacteria bacterium RIFCSPLOWO2_02_FULL_66_14]|nr:MAG: mammalian cell entry protein [Betaproteobacteria bacterium RIFCSPLOWO2_02_FULL_66_14]
MAAERERGVTFIPRDLGFKVGMLLAFTIAVVVAFLLYVLYARGVFEATQRLTLVAENAEGVGVGMDLTFSGFAIGTVRRISLAENGKARIEIEVPRADSKWLRATSIFTLERGLVGGAKLRAYSSDLGDPPLEDDAVRLILRGDATEELPRMVATMRTILENIEQLTGAGGGVQANLANLRVLTERMAGKQGLLGGILGTEDNAKKVIASIDRANALLASLGGVAARLDAVVAKTDQRVFAAGGVLDETQRAAAQANAILGDVRESLKKVDAILANAQGASADVKSATTDLTALRSEVEASLRKVTGLIDEINRKWPFERKSEIRLP